MNSVSRKQHLDRVAIGLLVVCCMFWGFQQVLAKATLPEVAPLFQAALRFAGATVLLLAWCAWRKIDLWQRDASLWPGLLAGALFALEFICIYLGLTLAGAARVTLLLYTSPFWVAMILPLLIKAERLGSWQWLGLWCAFLGVVLALQGGVQQRAQFGEGMGGELLALAAGAAWGLTTVVIRASALVRIRAEKILMYQIAVSAVVLPFASWMMGERWHFQISAFAWLSLALQTVVGAFASYLVWMWLLTRYPAAKLSAFVFLTPVCAMMFSALWLREPVTLPLVLALALVASGMLMVNRR